VQQRRNAAVRSYLALLRTINGKLPYPAAMCEPRERYGELVRDLRGLTPPELRVMHAAVSEELRRRGVIRSSNNPVGDLAEYLFCRLFGWKRAPNSMRDADATDAAEVRYQIKGRRLTPHNNSRQIGALRELLAQGFDVLAAVLFQEDYRILRAALTPHARVAVNTSVYLALMNSVSAASCSARSRVHR
jgi:hypothetical protein